VTRSSLEGGLWKPSALKAKTCGRGSSEQRQTRSATSSGGSCLLRSPANPLRAMTTCLGYIGRFRCQPSHRARCSSGSGADHGHATGGRPAHGAQGEPISVPGAARRRPDGNVCGGWAQRCTVCYRRAATAGTGNPQEIVGMRWSPIREMCTPSLAQSQERQAAHPAAGVTKWRTLEPLIRLPLGRRAITDTSYCSSRAGKAMQKQLEVLLVQRWPAGRQAGTYWQD
jgi:hypothetical protein